MEQEHDPELKRQLGDQLGELHHDQERSARTAAHVTDDMVRQVMFALSRLPGVSVMRAPYEADAQLAFLARQNLVHAVLTEDSDLVAYCLPRVLLKLDRQNATAQLIEKRNLMTVKICHSTLPPLPTRCSCRCASCLASTTSTRPRVLVSRPQTC